MSVTPSEMTKSVDGEIDKEVLGAPVEGVDLKGGKEKQEQEWVLKLGKSADFEELVSKEDAAHIIIFQKDSAEDEQAIETLTLSEVGERTFDSPVTFKVKKARQIVVCRTEFTANVLGRSDVSLGPEKFFTVFILFDDKEYARSTPPWGNLSHDYIVQGAIEPAMDYITSSFPGNDGTSIPGEDVEKQKAFFLKTYLEFNCLATSSFLGFTPSQMTTRVLDVFLERLQQIKMLNKKDSEFIKKISPCKKLPKELSDQLQTALAGEDYQQAIKIATAIHSASCAEAQERALKRSGRMSRMLLTDECDLAYKLGEELEKRGALREAVSAFEILTHYRNTTWQFDKLRFTSPYMKEAEKKVLAILTRLIDLAENEKERRELQNKFIKVSLWPLLAYQGYHVRPGDIVVPDLAKKVLALLETGCGTGSKSPPLFSHLDTSDCDKAISLSFLIEVIMTMSDRIYELQKGTSLAALPVAQAGDLKTKREHQEQTGAMVEKPVEGASAVSSALLMTPLRDSQRQKQQQMGNPTAERMDTLALSASTSSSSAAETLKPSLLKDKSTR